MSKSEINKKPRKYDDEFKLNIIEVYKKDERTAKDLAKDYGIPEGTLRGWIKNEENRIKTGQKGEKKAISELQTLKKRALKG